MNIWNKVFLGVIFVAIIATFVLGTVEFYIRGAGLALTDLTWIERIEDQIDRKKIRYEDLSDKVKDKIKKNLAYQIRQKDAEIAKIVNGTAPEKLSPDKSLSDLGIDELRGMLRVRYDERGRAWFGCIVADMDERTLPPALQQVETQIIITGPFAPSETGIATDVQLPATLNGVVYVFEDNAENHSGAFLGRFNVVGEPEPAKFPGDDENEKNGGDGEEKAARAPEKICHVGRGVCRQ
jgi:hypothetical protein